MKNFLWVFIILVLFACKNRQPASVTEVQKPDSLISRSQMVRILTDVHLTEAALAYIRTKEKSDKDLSGDYYNAVFSKYKISRKNFESNFDYYKRDQDGLIKMYEDVILNLENMNTQGKSKKPLIPSGKVP
jgi:hypothetical protein